MASKSKTTDATSTDTETTVIDRKAIQEQGQQIIDSLIVANDDKVVKEALAGVAVNFGALMDGNATTIGQLKSLAETVLTYINKGQADISNFGLAALEGANKSLGDLQAQGTFILKIADETVGDAMTMAQQVAKDQAQAQRDALEIVADTRTGDYADTLKYMSALVMAFTLAALYMVRSK